MRDIECQQLSFQKTTLCLTFRAFPDTRGFQGRKKGCSVYWVKRQWILNRRKPKGNETAIFALPLLSSHKRLTGQWMDKSCNPLIRRILVQTGGDKGCPPKRPGFASRVIGDQVAPRWNCRRSRVLSASDNGWTNHGNPLIGRILVQTRGDKSCPQRNPASRQRSLTIKSHQSGP